MAELKVGERENLEVTETDKESCKGWLMDNACRMEMER